MRGVVLACLDPCFELDFEGFEAEEENNLVVDANILKSYHWNEMISKSIVDTIQSSWSKKVNHKFILDYNPCLLECYRASSRRLVTHLEVSF